MSDSVRPHRQQPTRLPRPWDSPGKNTGLGCHFLLQCMKVKSESEVAQLCLTSSDPMDCSLPGSSIHGISQEIILEWSSISFCPAKGIFPTEGWNFQCWHWQVNSLPLSLQGSHIKYIYIDLIYFTLLCSFSLLPLGIRFPINLVCTV